MVAKCGGSERKRTEALLCRLGFVSRSSPARSKCLADGAAVVAAVAGRGAAVLDFGPLAAAALDLGRARKDRVSNTYNKYSMDYTRFRGFP